MKNTTFQDVYAAPARRTDRVLLAIMAVLFVGPLLAPLFQATSLPGVADTGALARDLLSLYVCPTPAKSYMLLGFPMGVCARCWGATIGLWAAWLALRSAARPGGPPVARRVVALWRSYTRLPWAARLGISSLPFWLWVAEIRWWAAAPYWALLINGAFAGFWAGLFFCSIWPAARVPQDTEFGASA